MALGPASQRTCVCAHTLGRCAEKNTRQLARASCSDSEREGRLKLFVEQYAQFWNAPQNQQMLGASFRIKLAKELNISGCKALLTVEVKGGKNPCAVAAPTGFRSLTSWCPKACACTSLKTPACPISCMSSGDHLHDRTDEHTGSADQGSAGQGRPR